MKFPRREIVLIAGIIFIVLGITQYVRLEYSALIGVALYLGIKAYVKRQRESIQNDIGGGICMECGSRIVDGKCPNCKHALE